MPLMLNINLFTWPIKTQCIVFSLCRTLHEIESAIESSEIKALLKPTLSEQRNLDIPTICTFYIEMVLHCFHTNYS